VVDGLTH